MAVMVLASAMSVSAAGSTTKPIEPEEPKDPTAGGYEITVESPKFDGLTADVEKKIEQMNKGEEVTITADVNKAIEGKKLVQKFFSVEPVGNHDQCDEQGYHVVTITVTGMTRSWKNITLVHYSPERATWETFSESAANPKNKLTVDYSKGTLTFYLVDLSPFQSSPFAIYADLAGNVSGDTSGDVVVGTSPSTQGVSSAWMLYTAMALIVLGSSVVVYQKKRG